MLTNAQHNPAFYAELPTMPQYTLTRVRVITGYRELDRYITTLTEYFAGFVPNTGALPHEPYRYSPTKNVSQDSKFGAVIICETGQRRYEVFRIEGPVYPTDAAALQEFTNNRKS